jgi:hypothetical protein
VQEDWTKVLLPLFDGTSVSTFSDGTGTLRIKKIYEVDPLICPCCVPDYQCR